MNLSDSWDSLLVEDLCRSSIPDIRSLHHVLPKIKCYRYSVTTGDLILPFWKSYEQLQNQSQAEFEENQFFQKLVFWSILTKYFLHWKWPPVYCTSIFSALTWPKTKSKDSFEKLRTSRFQNCPWLSDLIKIRLSYWGLKRKHLFKFF